MRWLKPSLRFSISGIFASGPHALLHAAAADVDIEDIRDSMLALLDTVQDAQFIYVRRRIRYTQDLLGLWYLRGDLMRALASRDGEAQAGERIKAITRLFDGMLPHGLNARPNPANASRG